LQKQDLITYLRGSSGGKKSTNLLKKQVFDPCSDIIVNIYRDMNYFISKLLFIQFILTINGQFNLITTSHEFNKTILLLSTNLLKCQHIFYHLYLIEKSNLN
jgi:hypothetical protein